LVVVVGIDDDTLDVVKPGAQDKVELGVVVWVQSSTSVAVLSLFLTIGAVVAVTLTAEHTSF
jgi:hypothetical protein